MTLEEALAKVEELTAAIDALKANNAALLAEKKQAGEQAQQATAQAGTLEQRLAQLEGQVGSLTTERDAALAESYGARVKDKLDPVFEGAAIAGTARPDVLARFNAEHELTEAGFVSKKDGTAVEPSQWVEGLREQAPHFWPASQGGGAGGSNNPGAPAGAHVAKHGDTSGYMKAVDAWKAGGGQGPRPTMAQPSD